MAVSKEKLNGFIAQTAEDYCMSYREVERIKKQYPNSFYEELENFIKERANQNSDPKHSNR